MSSETETVHEGGSQDMSDYQLRLNPSEQYSHSAHSSGYPKIHQSDKLASFNRDGSQGPQELTGFTHVLDCLCL